MTFGDEKMRNYQTKPGSGWENLKIQLALKGLKTTDCQKTICRKFKNIGHTNHVLKETTVTRRQS